MAAGNKHNAEIGKEFHGKLTDNQVHILALRSLVEGKEMFVGTRTGSGKSLIYDVLQYYLASQVCVS